MKKTVSYLISIIIAVGLIVTLKPYYEQYKQNQKYDFKLNSTQGAITKDSFKGKVLAVYFGYTFCPDVCPTSLSRLSEALKGFSKEKLDNFQAVFVSVDPDRDKLDDLQSYASYFHKNFMGATSDKKNIDDIVKRYGSYYKKVYLKNSAMNYSIAHTSYIYLFDKEGKFVAKIDHFSNPKELKEVLQSLL